MRMQRLCALLLSLALLLPFAGGLLSLIHI